MDLPSISEELAKVERQISHAFPNNSNEFQKPDKVEELIRWSRQLEALTDYFKRCERNEFQKLHEVKGLIQRNTESEELSYRLKQRERNEFQKPDKVNVLIRWIGHLEELTDNFKRCMRNEFQKLHEVNGLIQRNTESEELSYRLKQCERCVIDSDRVWKEVEGMDAGDRIKMLIVKKQLVTNELNSYASLKELQASILAKKQEDLFDDPGGVAFKDNHADLDKIISSSKLMSNSYQMTNEINQSTEKAVKATVSVGAEAAVTLRPQTRQMSRTINARNSIHFFIRQALLFVKKLCIQAATNPFTYMGFFVLGIVLLLATLEGGENELERQGFTYTCVDIPGNSEAKYCSWTRYLTEDVPPT